MDNTPYDGGASSYIEEEYPEYTYDASDMEYIMQRRDQNPMVYKNTLYKQIGEDRPQGVLNSLLHRVTSIGRRSTSSSDTTLYNYGNNSARGRDSLFYKLIQNPLVLIILVVVVSYLLSFIVGNLLRMDAGIAGLIELVVALLLSYGLSLYTDRNRDFVVKGTFVFFVSLIILIILIFV